MEDRENLTPLMIKKIGYIFISILMIIAVYPFIKNSFYYPKFTELAILGSTGNIGEYPHQVQLNQDLSLNIFLSNHEKETKLYKIVIKLVENSTLKDSSSPFDVIPFSSHIFLIGENKNMTHPINIVFDKPFSGKIIAELYMFNLSDNDYLYHDRWVGIWMKVV